MADSASSHSVFVQRSRLGWAAFHIQGEHLEVATSQFGRKSQANFLLRSIDPRHRFQSQRLYHFWAVPLLLSIVFGVITWEMMHMNGVLWDLGCIFGASFAMTLLAAIRGFPPIQFYQFRDHWGRPRFNIVRERAQAAECDAFVAQLAAHIEIATSADSPESFANLLKQLAATGAADDCTAFALEIGQGRWKIAIFAGALAAGLPLIPNNYAMFGDFGFFVVFFSCVSALTFGTLSFLAKERWRWWSILGMALALIPPFFYSS